MAAGRDTAAHSMVTLAGGQNVMSDMVGYKATTPEAVILGAPEYVLAPQRTLNSLGSPEALFSLPELLATPAAAERNLLVFEDLYLTGFGPRTVAAVLELATRLHPELADVELSNSAK